MDAQTDNEQVLNELKAIREGIQTLVRWVTVIVAVAVIGGILLVFAY